MNSRKAPILNIIDDFNRQALAMDVEYSHSGISVCRVLERLVVEQGRPAELRTDNGPEFLSSAHTDFCEKLGITIRYIKPRPTQQGFVARFNHSYQQDILDAYLFPTMDKLRDMTWGLLQDYEKYHLHRL